MTKLTKSLRVLALFVFVALALFIPARSNAALFDPGRIIDDGIFTNKNAMSVGDIQNFLNSKVPVCDTWHPAGLYAQGANPPWICLKDYNEGGRSAAQIIWDAAQAYTINPQVLIVTLQKENGLVTDTWPYPWQYRTATGFACPDNGTCDPAYYGFTNQVNQAARHFRNFYDNNPNWWVPFRTGVNFIQWNPNSSCGGSNVNIVTRGTAALYSYTPYQPNAAALNNINGTGDACSAYGNRNFWRDFNNWFGSTFGNYNNVAINSKGSILTSGQRLNIGEYLISEGGNNILTLQEDGNLVLYRSGVAIWHSNTWLKQATYLEMQADGNLVIYNPYGNSIWNSGTQGRSNAYLKIQQDSNLVIYNSLNQPVWNTNTWLLPAQQLIAYSTLKTGNLFRGQELISPNKKYKLKMQNDGNLVLYSGSMAIWNSYTWAKPVKFVAMQVDGNLVLYDENKRPYWDTATWRKGISRMVVQDDGNLVIYSKTNIPTWYTNTVGR